ncbi:MAG: hypothetical protein IKT40_05990 [Bacilli bacterium]|nr:hypothetical protein [Bacilli bacterium]
MSRIFVIDDDRVADAIEMLLEKKKMIDARKQRRIHSFSDYEPRVARTYNSGCGSGGCGGCGGSTHRINYDIGGCGGRFVGACGGGDVRYDLGYSESCGGYHSGC